MIVSATDLHPVCLSDERYPFYAMAVHDRTLTIQTPLSAGIPGIRLSGRAPVWREFPLSTAEAAS
jgi:hypothetical protein